MVGQWERPPAHNLSTELLCVYDTRQDVCKDSIQEQNFMCISVYTRQGVCKDSIQWEICLCISLFLCISCVFLRKYIQDVCEDSVQESHFHSWDPTYLNKRRIIAGCREAKRKFLFGTEMGEEESERWVRRGIKKLFFFSSEKL